MGAVIEAGYEELSSSTLTIPTTAVGFAIASTYAMVGAQSSAFESPTKERTTYVVGGEQDADEFLLDSYVLQSRWLVANIGGGEDKFFTNGNYIGTIRSFETGIYGSLIEKHIAVVATHTRNSPLRMVLAPANGVGFVYGLPGLEYNVSHDLIAPLQDIGMAIAIDWANARASKELTRQISFKNIISSLNRFQTAQVTSTWQPDFEELKPLKALRENWNGYGAEPPNTVALDHARQVLKAAKAVKQQPQRVLASAVGGVSICFYREGKYAEVECYNTGNAVGITKVLSNKKRNIWEVDSIPDTVAAIRQFLEGKTESDC